MIRRHLSIIGGTAVRETHVRVSEPGNQGRLDRHRPQPYTDYRYDTAGRVVRTIHPAIEAARGSVSRNL